MIKVTPAKFREMRKAMGYSQAKIARWFGVTDHAVRRWEHGRNKIDGCAKVLMWLLYDQEVNGNKNAVQDYVQSVQQSR